ncbi:transposable element Tcb1 transposase [Trichonephila clavipes]|nr:transposable element Tcb1 transposase [Trichonephila clavipes]
MTDHTVTSHTVAQHIESETHHSVSACTIRRRLLLSGMSARRPLLGLPFTQNHRRLHRQWCDERRIIVVLGRSHVLITLSPIPKHKETFEDVSRFCLITGHNFLGVYHPSLDMAAEESCPLCGHGRMDSDYLFQCTEADEYPNDDIVSRYREAQCQMVKKPSMGVG